MNSQYIQQIATDLGLPVKQVGNVEQLHAEGATIPFISRYRKEATGNMDEVQITAVIDKIKYYDELEKRKETVLKTIEAAGKLTPELKQRIDHCINATELEDIYLPYKPKRKTKASVAIEKGLEPLAGLLFAQGNENVETAAAGYVNEQVKDVADALQGARDIMAEWIAESEQARTLIRSLFSAGAVIASRVLTSKKEDAEAQKYRDYFDFKEPLAKCPSHRILAIRRGEKEGYLIMDIAVEKDTAIGALKKEMVTSSGAASEQVALAVEDAYTRLLKPAIETEFRLNSKVAADEEAIKVFAENLRQLLLAPPLGHKRVLAIDPGFRTGCKVVCLDESGTFLKYETIFPHPPQNDWHGATEAIKRLVRHYDIEAIGYGNGTASKETEKLVRSIDFGKPISIFMVNESGASIYSASEVAREEFPEEDVTVRGAISIGRRLLDPLSELVKIDAKSIGVGQYQHDVNQNRLKESLDNVVQSCVNYVGVDVNTASKHLLMYVSGLTATTAKNIVEYRTKNGAFKSRGELLKVSMLGPKAYEQCAGFLRIPNAANPLDNSAVHPESYPVVESMASHLNCTVSDLIVKPGLRKTIKARDFVTETAGLYTIEDILKELEKPGRDPREAIEEFRFAEGLSSIEDLKPGMKVPGIITNITNFGAFVDVGVKQDGLIHVSHLSNKFVSDPNEVVKLNQKVEVTVLEVDVLRKRISLSMKNSDSAISVPGVRGNRSRPENGNGKPKNSFQSSLDALRKKFAD
ncbi:RNA-binding transcriptional accessory protein [Niabella ginsenosidivorans]|uniref:RNA-binding transcriptional accessory protein n=1 Tax=Niabella ginsenosidivorans TaxID=1176587 RepID=A0A1A9I176_9BACT|nr:Tex family protein [Niabella ginsenosidivorans]ANH81408.1 RNA-binding transcriptional accessory protein [Niabella ginsenosidivorans]